MYIRGRRIIINIYGDSDVNPDVYLDYQVVYGCIVFNQSNELIVLF